MGIVARTPGADRNSRGRSTPFVGDAVDLTSDSLDRDCRELVCADCGYRVRVRRAPDRCPMCQGSDWRPPQVSGRSLLDS